MEVIFNRAMNCINNLIEHWKLQQSTSDLIINLFLKMLQTPIENDKDLQKIIIGIFSLAIKFCESEIMPSWILIDVFDDITLPDLKKTEIDILKFINYDLFSLCDSPFNYNLNI